MLGPLRVMAPCMAMGEAAGTAAALAICQRTGFAELDPALLREELRGHAAIVDREHLPAIQPRVDP